jgi:hypothetical protein
MHLKLLCQDYPTKVLERVRQIKKNEVHIPLEKCLSICQEHKQIEASAIFFNKLQNYFSAAEAYITLLTDTDAFDYIKLIKQLSKITESGQSIPHFIPYLTKPEKLKNKEILKCMARNDPIKDSIAPLIVRFDNIIRKVVKISIKESNENPDEDKINLTWFYTLDKIFSIRAEQLNILEAVKRE